MSAKRIALYGLLASMMLVLGFVERQFVLAPGIPGIRLGLSNTVLLYALCLMGAKDAWLLMLLKVLLGGFLLSGVSGMMYSLSGGFFSMLAMQLVIFVGGMGMIGISVSGATMHMLGQILMSRIQLGTWAALAQSPVLLVAAVVTGVLTGIAAHAACQGVARGDAEMQTRLKNIGTTRRRKL